MMQKDHADKCYMYKLEYVQENNMHKILVTLSNKRFVQFQSEDNLASDGFYRSSRAQTEKNKSKSLTNIQTL